MACVSSLTTTHQTLVAAKSHNNLSNSTLSFSFPSPGYNNFNSTMNCSSLRCRRDNMKSSSRLYFAATPGTPPPPETDPSSNTKTGIKASLSKLQDKLQIFFAVLFWMSLFFWACAWDGKDDGRPNKGS